MRPPGQSLGSAGGGSPGSGRTCKDDAAALDATGPVMSYYTTPSTPEPNPGTKGTIGMTTRPNIIAQDLSAVHAVGGNER